MDDRQKLHVKIGDHEFNAEGPESTLKEWYEKFLENIKGQPKPLVSEAASHDDTETPDVPYGVDGNTLNRVFLPDGEIVSLRLLPSAENPNRTADAAILLLYGFKRLLKVENVLVTRLNEALRRSGLPIDRVDRIISVHGQYYMKGGTRSGGRYSLNNQGEAQAEKWLREWFSK